MQNGVDRRDRTTIVASLPLMTDADNPGRIGWRLRMAAAERGIWSAAELRRALRDRAGYELTSASVSALLTGQPREVRLATLAALCRALDCAPNDLLVVPATESAGRRGPVVPPA